MAKAFLECTRGPERGEEFRLPPGAAVVGRDPSADIVLGEQSISRRHFRVEREGNTWYLVNLSSNGTRVNKKEAEEVELADGDEIRLGAKTRLQFRIEEVALSESGRPQFRTRTRPAEEESAEEESVEDETASLFERRKKLFIGLGIYLGVIAVAGIVFGIVFSGGESGDREDGIPELTVENQIVFPDGRSYTISSKTEAALVYEGPEGPTRISQQEVREKGARRVRGIRSYVEELPEHEQPDERNPDLARQHLQRARLAYERYPQDHGALWESLRHFQKARFAFGYGGFENPADRSLWREVKSRLIEDVYDLYNRALRAKKANDWPTARRLFERLSDMVPERTNPIRKNIEKHLVQVRRKIEEAD